MPIEIKPIKPLKKKKKGNKVKPTAKQKKAFKEIVENGRNKGEAMIEAGYSENTAVAPTKVTESKGWQQLMDEYIPDELLQKVHKEGLEAVKLEGGKKVADSAIRHKYLDTGYKLKRKYAGDKLEDTIEDQMQKDIEERRKLKAKKKKQ